MAIGVAVMMLATAEPSLADRVAALLAREAPGARIGLLVSQADGRELVAIRPDERFVPASNAKMVVTAAAFAMLPGLDRPDAEGGARVRLEPHRGRAPDVVLEGRGDARLSSAPDCVSDCLATLADAVARAIRRVGAVVGDDGWFPDERWASGMSWNNFQTRSGTAASALTLDDDVLVMTVTPGSPGGAPGVDLPGYYRLANRATTVAAGASTLGVERLPGEDTIRLTGTIAAGATPERLTLGIDDPARYAAWTFRRMLVARGVRVSGAVLTRHRPPSPADDPATRRGAPPARPPATPALAQLTPPPLADDLLLTNKISQNLHAELLLRRLGKLNGEGSVADGLAAERIVLAQAGVAPGAATLADGSGMSTYDRLTPRAAVTLLRWIAARPWGAAWRATLPVAGGQGLKRLAGTPLDGRVTAKTGTLNATSALSGWLLAKSGRTLAFSVLANDVPEGVNAANAIDDALALVAAGA